MKKDILIISAITLVAIIVGVYFIINSGSSNNSTLNQTNENGTTINQSQNSVIELTDLAKHNTQSDCWVAFRGKVLDLTEFLPKHPGSAAAIIPYCGTSTEFENAFIAKHGEVKVKFLMMVGKLMGDFKVVGTTN